MKGIKRFRQAIKNQRDAGEGEFRLTYHDAEEIATEIDAELLGICSSAVLEIGRYAWAYGAPAPVDADGEVVPLTTKVMYTGFGDEITLKRFMFYYSNFRKCFVWHVASQDDAIFSLNILHLTFPDSWEKLEEDAKLAPRAYLEKRGMNPEKTERVASMMADLVSRAKALAERDAKGDDCD